MLSDLLLIFFFTSQSAPEKLARHMQTAFIQIVEMFVFVLIVLQRGEKFVVQMAKPTNIPANFKRVRARKTRTFQLFHRVDVEVCYTVRISISGFYFIKSCLFCAMNSSAARDTVNTQTVSLTFC